jgi:hypothetical protein
MGIDRLLKRLAVDTDFSEFQSVPCKLGTNDCDSCISSRSARFFERLLRNEMLLKEALPGDVCTAQGDLRRLRTEQLLCIRGQTLNFVTESASHGTHSNFLDILDRHLFEQLARRHLEDQTKNTQGSNRVLHRLGLCMTRILGVELAMAEAANKKRQNPILGCLDTAMGVDLEIPQFWILHPHGYDGREKLAPQSAAVLFDSRSLQLRRLPEECSDWSAVVGNDCNLVAVYTDRSTGHGKERQLHWNIVGLNPTDSEIRAELARARRAAAKFHQHKSKHSLRVIGKNSSLETVYESPVLDDHAADAFNGEGDIHDKPAVQSVASLVRMVEARSGGPVAQSTNGSALPLTNLFPGPNDDDDECFPPALPPRLTRRPSPIITARAKVDSLKRRRPVIAAGSSSRDTARLQPSGDLTTQKFLEAFAFWKRLEIGCCIRRDGVLV